MLSQMCACSCCLHLYLTHLPDSKTCRTVPKLQCAVQAWHDEQAAGLVQALTAAACIPLLSVAPSARASQEVAALAHLVQGLQVLHCLSCAL